MPKLQTFENVPMSQNFYLPQIPADVTSARKVRISIQVQIDALRSLQQVSTHRVWLQRAIDKYVAIYGTVDLLYNDSRTNVNTRDVISRLERQIRELQAYIRTAPYNLWLRRPKFKFCPSSR